MSMANLGFDMLFWGTDGGEAEAFVTAIREFAFVQKREGDDWWIVHFATNRLRGKALRWHATLPANVKKDWNLFVEALFEHYPPKDYSNSVQNHEDEDGIATPVWTTSTFTVVPAESKRLTSESETLNASQTHTSPPNPPLVYNSLLPGFQVGRLRVEYEAGRPGPHYIWNGLGSKSITTSAHDALIVSFIPSNESHRIYCRNTRYPGCCQLALKHSALSAGHEYYTLAGIDPGWTHAKQPDMAEDRFHPYFAVWSVDSVGVLQVTLGEPKGDENGSSKLPCTSIAYVDITGTLTSFTADPKGHDAVHPVSKIPIVPARIVFEPVD